MYVKMGPKVILNCGCTLNGGGEGAHILVQLVQSGKYSVIIPGTSVQVGSRASANERTRKEAAHTEACWVQHLSHYLITCPWRVGTAALSSSRAILFPPSSFCPSNISITFKNDRSQQENSETCSYRFKRNGEVNLEFLHILTLF